nr:15049_t:CDS:2 [Entrophospora candida]
MHKHEHTSNKEFTENYSKMIDEKKFKLPLNKYVKDIIFNYGKTLNNESFIVDIENNMDKKLFEEKDWNYIITYNLSNDPKLSDNLMDHMIQYRKVQEPQANETITKGIASIEEGRLWEGEKATKHLLDGSLKMPKVMKDMLQQKIKKTGIDFMKKNNIEIISFLHSG